MAIVCLEARTSPAAHRAAAGCRRARKKDISPRLKATVGSIHACSLTKGACGR